MKATFRVLTGESYAARCGLGSNETARMWPNQSTIVVHTMPTVFALQFTFDTNDVVASEAFWCAALEVEEELG